MGYDLTRFVGDEVDEELVCPICSGVLDDPVQAPLCEHAFCSGCISEWIRRQATCPVDRNSISIAQLKPVPRILKNLLARLEITCDNADYGCTATLKLDLLPGHLKECEFNPRKPVSCTEGCGLAVPKDEMNRHNCVRELRSLVKSYEAKIESVTGEVGDVKYQLAEQRRDINVLKDLVRCLRASQQQSSIQGGGGGGVVSSSNSNSHLGAGTSHGRTVTDQMQDDGVLRWAAGLPRARVTRWGGMISTPDSMLQDAIKRSLTESGCPPHIVNELMENAHERRWPTGLLTLETRQMNRRQYGQYVCKRIPNKQAVVVMACDNMHMSDDMILEPGLVMIFAHGIE